MKFIFFHLHFNILIHTFCLLQSQCRRLTLTQGWLVVWKMTTVCKLHFGFDLFDLRCISTGSGGHSVRDATDRRFSPRDLIRFTIVLIWLILYTVVYCLLYYMVIVIYVLESTISVANCAALKETFRPELWELLHLSFLQTLQRNHWDLRWLSQIRGLLWVFVEEWKGWGRDFRFREKLKTTAMIRL